MTAHEYGRRVESAARSLCERMNVDANELLEMAFPGMFFRRWQLVAEDLVNGHARRLPPDEAEKFRVIGIEYILAGGVGSVRCETVQ